MVRNNIKLDEKTKCYRTGKDAGSDSRADDTIKAYINCAIKKSDYVVNRTFVQIMEALEYDIQPTYIKKRRLKVRLYT